MGCGSTKIAVSSKGPVPKAFPIGTKPGFMNGPSAGQDGDSYHSCPGNSDSERGDPSCRVDGKLTPESAQISEFEITFSGRSSACDGSWSNGSQSSFEETSHSPNRRPLTKESFSYLSRQQGTIHGSLVDLHKNKNFNRADIKSGSGSENETETPKSKRKQHSLARTLLKRRGKSGGSLQKVASVPSGLSLEGRVNVNPARTDISDSEMVDNSGSVGHYHNASGTREIDGKDLNGPVLLTRDPGAVPGEEIRKSAAPVTETNANRPVEQPWGTVTMTNNSVDDGYMDDGDSTEVFDTRMLNCQVHQDFLNDFGDIFDEDDWL